MKTKEEIKLTKRDLASIIRRNKHLFLQAMYDDFDLTDIKIGIIVDKLFDEIIATELTQEGESTPQPTDEEIETYADNYSLYVKGERMAVYQAFIRGAKAMRDNPEKFKLK